jgi:glycine oxidase
VDSADLIIVGGGIVGLSVAQRAVLEGFSVILFSPRDGLDSSASLAAGAMLGAFGEITNDQNSSTDNLETDFRIEASDQYEDWLTALTQESNQEILRGMGTFVIANTFGRNDLINVNAIQGKLSQHNRRFQIVDENEVPGYSPNYKYAPRKVLFIPDEGYVNPTHVIAALQSTLKVSNKFKYHSLAIRQLIVENDRVIGVMDERGEKHYAADVVIAAGTGTPALFENLPYKLSVPHLMPGKGTSLVVKTTQQFPYVLRTPNRDFACGLHVVPRGGSELYIGATNRTAACPGTNEGATIEEVHDLLHEVVHEFNTHLDSAVIKNIRYGSRPICVDGHPLIGTTEVNGLSLATGTYRNGVLMAPLIAEIIIDELAGKNSRYLNPFKAKDRRINESLLASSNLFQKGAEGIVSFLPSPHGNLPYKRTEELTSFIEALLKLSFQSDDKVDQLRNEVKDLIKSQPMTETFAQLFFMLGERIDKIKIKSQS